MLTADQIREYPLFAGLSDVKLARLASLLTRRVLAKRAYLFYPGNPGGNTYLVESGLMRLFFTDSAGQEFLLNLVGPFEVLSLSLLDDEQARLMGAAAYQASVVLSIARDDLFEFMTDSPQLMRNIYRELSVSARKLLLHTRTLVTVGLDGRLATMLLRLSRKGDDGRYTVSMPLNQAELAGWIGASRGRLNRAITQLQQEGLIRVAEQEIEILDRGGLESLTEEPISENQ